MDDQGLDFIRDENGRSLVRDMLAAIVDHPDLHPNRFRYQNVGGGQYLYFVAKSAGGSAFPEYSRLSFDVVEMLVAHRWAEGDDSPGHGKGWYRFTEEALDWYRRNCGPTDEQVQSGIGRHFRRMEERDPGQPHHFDAHVIARELGVGEDRVVAQTHFLVGSGLLEDVGPGGTKTPDFYQLSRPVGFRWAAAGFPPIAGLGSTTVNVQVDVRITVRQFLLDLGSLDVPEHVKQEAAETVEELQREPTIEKVGKLMELGANAATLVPTLVRFFTENGAALQQLLH